MSRLALVNEKGNPTPAGSRFLQRITDALNGTQDVVAVGVAQVTLGTGQNVSSGVGSPEGVVPGNIGDQYTNTAGGAGATIWIKESGDGTNVGWAAK